MTDDTIKRCPFCGSTADWSADWYHIPSEWGYVNCNRDSCDARGPFRRTRKGAIAAWNRRKGDD